VLLDVVQVVATVVFLMDDVQTNSYFLPRKSPAKAGLVV
jgi:hypothetical protein